MDEENLTVKGLKIVTIAYSILFLSSFLILLSSITGIRFEIIYIEVIASFTSLISLAIIYFGIQFIYKGNKEFTKEHEKNTNFARKLVFYGIIIYILGLFFLETTGIGVFLDEAVIMIDIIQTLLFVPFWLALVYLIKEITDYKIVKLLWFAFFTRIILHIVSNNSYKIGVALNVASQNNLLFVFIMSFIAMIPSLIFIYCYYSTYQKLRNSNPLHN